MIRLFHLVSAILALAWVPMTQHCLLEATGVVAAHCEHSQNSSGDGCTLDGCKALETGSYKVGSANPVVKAPGVAMMVFVTQEPVTVPLIAVQSGQPKEGFERPLDWVPSWHFVRRSALPSRAPSLVVA